MRAHTLTETPGVITGLGRTALGAFLMAAVSVAAGEIEMAGGWLTICAVAALLWTLSVPCTAPEEPPEEPRLEVPR